MRSSSWLAMTVAKFPTQLSWEAKEMKRSLGWFALRVDSYGSPDGRLRATFLSHKMLCKRSLPAEEAAVFSPASEQRGRWFTRPTLGVEEAWQSTPWPSTAKGTWLLLARPVLLFGLTIRHWAAPMVSWRSWIHPARSFLWRSAWEANKLTSF